jgi:ribosomal protein S18 acetylase RimI-like enzyme
MMAAPDSHPMTAGVVVRQLGVADAPRYRALRLESLRQFPDSHRSDYGEALEQPLSWAEKRLSTAGEYWFGAFDGQELVGAVCLRTDQSAKVRHVATLAALAVDGRRHGQRIGSTLVAHLIGFARSLGHIRQVNLTVWEGNTRAERLYDAFGFAQFGLERDAFALEGRYYGKQHRQLFL